MKRFLLPVFLALPALSMNVMAATWFVATNGNDSNSCTTSASSCLTFNGAYQKAGLALGDTVQIAAGTYGSQNLRYRSSLANGQAVTTHVTFQPATGASVTVNGDLNFGSTRFEAGASHVTVKDITITNGDVSIPGCGQTPAPCPPDATSPGNDITLVNLRVKGSYAFYCASCSNVTIDGGIWGPDTYNSPCTGDHHPEIASADQQPKRANHILIQNSEWKNFARCTSAEHTECLQIEPADDVTLRGNKFHDCDTIIVNIANDFGHWANSAAGFAAPNNVVVENNFFGAATDATGGPTYFALNIRECTNCIVRYNSWLQAPRMPTGEISQNVRYIGNVGTNVSWNCSAASFSHNVWTGPDAGKCDSSDKIAATPGFINSANLDLHLNAGSPAIGAGDTTNFPAFDIDGKPRPTSGPVDAGAAQFSASSTGLNPPTNLSLIVR